MTQVCQSVSDRWSSAEKRGVTMERRVCVCLNITDNTGLIWQPAEGEFFGPRPNWTQVASTFPL